MPVIKTIKNVFSGPLCKKCGAMMDTIYAGKYYCSNCQKHDLAKYAIERHEKDKVVENANN